MNNIISADYSKLLPRLARDLKNELPDVKGFSATNIKRMAQIYREYASQFSISPQAVGQMGSAGILPQPVTKSLPLDSEVETGPQVVDQLRLAIIGIQVPQSLPKHGSMI